MSFEEEIRRKHRYEAGVRQFERQILEFLSACRIYDREALELIMARLLDRIQASSDPEVIIDAKFKGSLTKMVFDDRLRGQERSRRPFFGPHYYWDDMPGWNFDYPDPLTESSLDDYTKKYSDGIRLLAK